jgi:hypothetical protein
MVTAGALGENARDLEGELSWFARVVDARCKLYFGHEVGVSEVRAILPPELGASSSPYARFVRRHALSFDERLALVLALVPHLRPLLLDVFFLRNQTFDRRFTEFGGARQGHEGDFYPTGETLAFLLGGTDLETRFRVQALFAPEHSHGTASCASRPPSEASCLGSGRRSSSPTSASSSSPRGARTAPTSGQASPRSASRRGSTGAISSCTQAREGSSKRSRPGSSTARR